MILLLMSLQDNLDISVFGMIIEIDECLSARCLTIGVSLDIKSPSFTLYIQLVLDHQNQSWLLKPVSIIMDRLDDLEISKYWNHAPIFKPL